MTSGFDEQDLVRALTAPPTADELADEVVYRALFRAEGPTRLAGVTVLRPVSGRTVRRVGAASTLAVAFALAGAGVAAAAYSSHLPAPVQGAFHRVLGPVGVPAADPPRATERAATDHAGPPQPEAPVAPAPADPTTAPTAEPSALPTAEPSAEPEPTATATVDTSPDGSPAVTPSGTSVPLPVPTGATAPSTPTSSPATEASASPTPTPTGSPSQTPSISPTSSPTSDPSASSTPTPTPTPTPTLSPTPAAPAEVSIAAAVGHRVAPGQTTVFSGVVSAADGSPVPNARVVLQEHTGFGWRDVGAGLTAEDGSVSLASQPASRTARYRIKVQDLHSQAWRLVLRPTLTASASTSGAVTTVTVTVSGGRAGSPALLMTRRDGEQVVVTSGSLAANGRIRFEVPAPTVQSWYAVRLTPSATHAGASTRVLVHPGTAPAVTPSP